MLEVKNMKASYGSIQAIQDISLQVKEGQIVSLIGANGAGKSTLLKCISGLMTEKTGSILFQGEEISKLPTHKIISKGISHVPEGRQLFARLKVQDNLDLGTYLKKGRENKQKVKQQQEEIFELFPILKERSQQIAGTLSGGEQQMLAIGRAMMSNPDLLMLDEPSLGLAPLIVENIFKIIKKLNEQGTTILLVEQNAQIALSISHKAYVIETGRKTLEGTGEELMHDDKVREAYLGA